MSINIGLDIGGVSLKLAAIGDVSDAPLLQTLTAKSGSFFAAEFPAGSPLAGRPLVLSKYRRIQGSPIQSTFDLLKELYEFVPEHMVEGIRVTGSGSQLIAKILGIYFENEFRAVAKGMRTFYPEVRTVFEMGGEASKYLRLEPTATAKYLGITDYSSSGDCAAGTGSFIDQQASRLLYNIEEVGPAACEATCAARIAGRCSVFAKSDMIHAQQKGYSTDQILRGLCDAVARNFKSAIVKGREVVAPVAFIGAVGLNQGVVNAMREAFKLDGDSFFVPEYYSWVGALGAGIFEAEERKKRTFKRIHQLQQHAAMKQQFACSDALSMENVVLLRDHVKDVNLPENGTVDAYLGIDIGSVSTNLVLIDADGNLLYEIYLRTQGRPIEVVNAGLHEIEEKIGAKLNIKGVGTTGSGRELIGELVGADTVNDEITAHKTGAYHVSKTLNMEPVDTIFEIGGQDSKFIAIDHGVVVDFTMNEACAAGTGSFLEEQAEKLGVSIKGEFAARALASKNPARLGERCTVFMERDVTGLMLKGAEVGDLCAGLAYSVALNYLNRVVRGRKIGKTIFFQGGTAYNDAVAAAFSQVLGKKVIVPPHNGVIGAIGMALIARDVMKDKQQPSKFRGYDLNKVDYSTREFVCHACSNYCDMKEFRIEGEKTYWGDKCSDKFRKRAKTSRKPVVEDLIEYRDKLLAELVRPCDGDDKRPTIGIPRAMFYFDRYPFWAAYFQELGFKVVPSAATDRTITADGEELSIAQPCFPVKVAHGHVQNLIEKGVDYILIPNAVNYEIPEQFEKQLESHLCPWNQTLPFVIRAVPQLEAHADKVVCPTVHFRFGRKHVEKELGEYTKAKFNINGSRARRALEAAYGAQAAFTDAMQEAGKKAMEELARSGEPALILVGRAYNLYDRSVNCDIPRKLRTLYGVNVLPMDFLPLDDIDILDVNPNMYWNSGRKILQAARMARKYPNLHVVYISNFKCGPDSYIKSFLDDATGKPSLILQFDGHANDAGFITRCEAYLDSKGFLRSCPSATVM
ncbi:MAG TPA: acyl-CoA dehydratase activase [Terriglobales bacterium]|nr:acyl-CoA dehydratase activase [Terriglobales bacterium]